MKIRNLVAMVPAVFLIANPVDTSTGVDLNKFPHPALTKVRGSPLRPGERTSFDGINAEIRKTDPADVVLHGRGKSGKTWTAHLCDFCFSKVWRGDLDGNGVPDYVIFGSGPYFNGRTVPSFSLSFLLMDREGIPVPFFTVVYKGDGDEGIKHLVGDSTGVRLLISTYDEISSDPRSGTFGSGHWVTQIYRFADTTVEEIRGRFFGLTFPFVHRWTYGVQPYAPFRAAADPAIYERGTTGKAAVRTRLLPEESETLWVPIEPAAGCTSVEPSATILDTRAAREIAFPNDRSQAENALYEKIREAHTAVELRGMDQCRATLLWARSNP